MKYQFLITSNTVCVAFSDIFSDSVKTEYLLTEVRTK